MGIRWSFCSAVILAVTIVFMAEAKAADSFSQQQQLRAPTFSISTASNFRTALKGLRPVKISGSTVTYESMPFAPVVGTMPASAPVTGTVPNPYTSPQGVVVSVVQPVNSPTGSRLDKIQLMDYTPAFRANIAANNPQTSANCYIPKTPGFVVADALFKGFPSGRHVYAVSIGTNIPKEYIQIYDFNSSAALTGPQLVSNPSTGEVTGLFSLEPTFFKVQLKVSSPPAWWYNFHHIQMTCLDCQ